MDLADKFRLVLASSLREDGFADQGEWSPLETGPKSRAMKPVRELADSQHMSPLAAF